MSRLNVSFADENDLPFPFRAAAAGSSVKPNKYGARAPFASPLKFTKAAGAPAAGSAPFNFIAAAVKPPAPAPQKRRPASALKPPTSAMKAKQQHRVGIKAMPLTPSAKGTGGAYSTAKKRLHTPRGAAAGTPVTSATKAYLSKSVNKNLQAGREARAACIEQKRGTALEQKQQWQQTVSESKLEMETRMEEERIALQERRRIADETARIRQAHEAQARKEEAEKLEKEKEEERAAAREAEVRIRTAEAERRRHSTMYKAEGRVMQAEAQERARERTEQEQVERFDWTRDNSEAAATEREREAQRRRLSTALRAKQQVKGREMKEAQAMEVIEEETADRELAAAAASDVAAAKAQEEARRRASLMGRTDKFKGEIAMDKEAKQLQHEQLVQEVADKHESRLEEIAYEEQEREHRRVSLAGRAEIAKADARERRANRHRAVLEVVAEVAERQELREDIAAHAAELEEARRMSLAGRRVSHRRQATEAAAAAEQARVKEAEDRALEAAARRDVEAHLSAQRARDRLSMVGRRAVDVANKDMQAAMAKMAAEIKAEEQRLAQCVRDDVMRGTSSLSARAQRAAMRALKHTGTDL